MCPTRLWESAMQEADKRMRQEEEAEQEAKRKVAAKGLEWDEL